MGRIERNYFRLMYGYAAADPLSEASFSESDTANQNRAPEGTKIVVLFERVAKYCK